MNQPTKREHRLRRPAPPMRRLCATLLVALRAAAHQAGRATAHQAGIGWQAGGPRQACWMGASQEGREEGAPRPRGSAVIHVELCGARGRRMHIYIGGSWGWHRRGRTILPCPTHARRSLSFPSPQGTSQLCVYLLLPIPGKTCRFLGVDRYPKCCFNMRSATFIILGPVILMCRVSRSRHSGRG